MSLAVLSKKRAEEAKYDSRSSSPQKKPKSKKIIPTIIPLAGSSTLNAATKAHAPNSHRHCQQRPIRRPANNDWCSPKFRLVPPATGRRRRQFQLTMGLRLLQMVSSARRASRARRCHQLDPSRMARRRKRKTVDIVCRLPALFS